MWKQLIFWPLPPHFYSAVQILLAIPTTKLEAINCNVHLIYLDGNALFHRNQAGYTATKVACGWAGAIFEVTRPFWQEQ